LKQFWRLTVAFRHSNAWKVAEEANAPAKAKKEDDEGQGSLMSIK
jgi:hypothetical protein